MLLLMATNADTYCGTIIGGNTQCSRCPEPFFQRLSAAACHLPTSHLFQLWEIKELLENEFTLAAALRDQG